MVLRPEFRPQLLHTRIDRASKSKLSLANLWTLRLGCDRMRSDCDMDRKKTLNALDLKQAIAFLSESDFRSAAATEPAGLV